MANVLYKIMGQIGLDAGDTSKQLDDIKGKAEDTSEAVGGGKKSLTQRMNTFGNGAKRVGGQLTSAGKTMTKGFTAPILGVGGALLAGANKVGNMADEILDLQAVTGMNTDALQEWRHVADVAGVSQDTVADSARRMIQRIDSLTESTDENAEMFDKLGLTHEKWAANSPEEQIEDVVHSLANMDDELERNLIAQEFFGKGWVDMAPILDSTSGELFELRSEAHKTGKVMSNDALNDANDFRVEMQGLKDEFAVAGREMVMNFLPILRDDILPLIRDHVIPFVTSLAERIGSLAEWFVNLSPGMQGVVAGFVGLLAAIGPIMGILGPLITLVGALATAKWALMIPILLKVAAFLAIVAVIAFVIIYWEELLEFIMAFISAVVQGLVFLVKTIGKWLIDGIVLIFKVFMAIWNGLIEFLSTVFTMIVEGLIAAVKQIGIWLVDGVKFIVEGFFTIMESIVTFIVDLTVDIMQGIIDLVYSIQEWLEGKISDVIEGFKNIWRSIIEFLTNLIDNIVESVKEMVTRIREWVVDRVKALIERFKENWESAREFASKLVSRITQPFIDIYNTIKEFIQDKIGGIIEGFKGNFESMRETISEVWDRITGIFERSIDAIKGFFDFQFKWPRIPMPKFGINPSGWKIGDLLKGSIPKLDIQWNAAGGIFDSPTLFNTANAGMQGVGEAGPEAIIPLNNRTLGGIGKGVGETMDSGNAALIAEMRAIRDEIKKQQTQFTIEMDKREVGRSVRDEIDKGLGQKNKSRKASKGR